MTFWQRNNTKYIDEKEQCSEADVDSLVLQEREEST
jgi:hypothetical protein